ncbi:hypothetical protein [Bacillus seohaeanensis]|uniref:Uncharacterized protein n=1 Tax=Bacillus seohaeanensis TaxID=284580 RepID=A0ABW5RQ32_9BACI
MKEKIGMAMREGIGWFITGIGFYLVFAKGFNLLNLLLLFIGLLGIFLNFPYKKTSKNN